VDARRAALRELLSRFRTRLVEPPLDLFESSVIG
jgi:hypothetical protein